MRDLNNLDNVPDDLNIGRLTNVAHHPRGYEDELLADRISCGFGL